MRSDLIDQDHLLLGKKNGLFVFPYDELKQFYDWNETDQRRVTTTCGLPNKRIQVIQFGL